LPTYKTGFGFEDRIYWTLIQLVNDISQITILDWTLSTSDHTNPPTKPSVSQSQSYVTTDGQSDSWNKAPIWGLRPDF
jgi:hypothetical protein